jgi:cytochrome c oxidase assembly protein subunit 15
LVPKLALLFVLGAMQGVVGWLMVKSGLIDRPDVSHYRLAAHFCLAMLIYGGLIWVILSLIYPKTDAAAASIGRAPSSVRQTAFVSCGLVFLTALFGAFVAGLDAGLAFNTFPLMDGELVPAEILRDGPWYMNIINSVAGVQFTHRLLALATICAIFLFVWRCWTAKVVSKRLRFLALVIAAWSLFQGSLGAATVLLYVPVAVASAHQASGMVLWTLVVWAAYESLRGVEDKKRVATPDRVWSTNQRPGQGTATPTG